MAHVKLIEMNIDELHERYGKIYGMSYHLHKETLAYINELPELIDDLRMKVLLVQQATDDMSFDSEVYQALWKEHNESYEKLKYCFYILNVLIGFPLLIPIQDMSEKICLALCDPIWRYWSIGECTLDDYLNVVNELSRFPFIDFDQDEAFKNQLEKAIKIRDFIMENDKKE